MKTYTTAVSLLALSSVERTDRITDTIRGAQAYLKRNQLKEGVFTGGLGYGDEEPKRDPETGKFVIKRNGIPNLSASAFATEAMYESGYSMSDPFWKHVITFTRKCQNNSETNTEKWASNDGGFIYRPANSKAGQVKKPGGGIGYKSYGLMSYAGLMSLLYAYVDKSDQRVQSAMKRSTHPSPS